MKCFVKKDTMKAASGGFKVARIENAFSYDNEELYKVSDGDKDLLVVKLRTLQEYKAAKERNEIRSEFVFTTIENSQFIYWSDYELNTEDYVTQIN